MKDGVQGAVEIFEDRDVVFETVALFAVAPFLRPSFKGSLLLETELFHIGFQLFCEVDEVCRATVKSCGDFHVISKNSHGNYSTNFPAVAEIRSKHHKGAGFGELTVLQSFWQGWQTDDWGEPFTSTARLES